MCITNTHRYIELCTNELKVFTTLRLLFTNSIYYMITDCLTLDHVSRCRVMSCLIALTCSVLYLTM